MDIPVNANVNCADGACGCATHAVIDPLTQQVTHLVIKLQSPASIERLVPVNLVLRTEPNLIQLGCTRGGLNNMAPFTEIEWRPIGPCPPGPLLDEHLVHKLLMRSYFSPVKRKCIPVGKIAVHRGTRVRTDDGRVGRVERLLIDSADWRLTHLVLQTGPLWGQKTTTIPLLQVKCFGESVVALKKDAHHTIAKARVNNLW